jgi:hypothetical protein
MQPIHSSLLGTEVPFGPRTMPNGIWFRSVSARAVNGNARSTVGSSAEPRWRQSVRIRLEPVTLLRRTVPLFAPCRSWRNPAMLAQ